MVYKLFFRLLFSPTAGAGRRDSIKLASLVFLRSRLVVLGDRSASVDLFRVIRWVDQPKCSSGEVRRFYRNKVAFSLKQVASRKWKSHRRDKKKDDEILRERNKYKKRNTISARGSTETDAAMEDTATEDEGQLRSRAEVDISRRACSHALTNMAPSAGSCRRPINESIKTKFS